MKIPLEFIVRNMEKTQELEEIVAHEVAKLERVCGSLIRCRVVIEEHTKHPQGNCPYEIRIDVTLPPQQEIVVKREPNKNIHGTTVESILRDAFDAVGRQVKRIVDRRHPKQREKRKKEIIDPQV